VLFNMVDSASIAGGDQRQPGGFDPTPKVVDLSEPVEELVVVEAVRVDV
jgi:hypothetical protein